jgi:hypothetical protein
MNAERYMMVGPVEHQPCPQHPDHEVTYRWYWEVMDGPEHGDVEVVTGCSHPDHERDAWTIVDPSPALARNT